MSTAADGRATTMRTTFSRTTQVAASITADAATVWRLLTDASGYASWNSTIVSLDGEIAVGSTIKLVSTLDPKRTFTLKVKEAVPNSRLVWGDAMGNRVYSLTPAADGQTTFSMVEKIGGPVFPLFARMIPSFDESFERFAADLKAAAEA